MRSHISGMGGGLKLRITPQFCNRFEENLKNFEQISRGTVQNLPYSDYLIQLLFLYP